MRVSAEKAELLMVPVDAIDRNPENPRILFRQAELDELVESIRKYGLQVPISVYRDGKRYVLIDGERRWKCCLKLNKKVIPALVQEKPNALTNLVLMFNIHALREQWDLLTIALKLPRMIELLEKQLNRPPKEREIAETTGLKPGMIRRCKMLLELPQQYKDMMLMELKRPKAEQKLTEDLFIEMERSLKTVERMMPEVIPDKDIVRQVFIDKFRNGTISNRVDFRLIPKIAKAEDVDADRSQARESLAKLFQRNNFSIADAYESSVSDAYTERDLISRVSALLERLERLRFDHLDEELIEKLRSLVVATTKLLEGRE